MVVKQKYLKSETKIFQNFPEGSHKFDCSY